MLKDQNSGIVITIEANVEDHFLYFFMTPSLCIRGLRNTILPAIAIDDTSLKRKRRRTLFVVITVDGNEEICYVAFRIIDNNDAL